jgi:serine/threonine-protein kinase
MPLRPGDLFGRYELVARLGSGAAGDVFRAYDTLLGRDVALKILHAPEWTSGAPLPAEVSARILREARAAARIEHPNAVDVYDVGENSGLPFLTMELVVGKPLGAFVGDPAVPLSRRIRWLSEIARALGAAHALGLMHRDVKPDNVFVRDDAAVKVLDFGVARRAQTATGAAGATLGTLTGDGIVVGTPLYMAPEQMRGERIDGRADQFAWGVLAYELLTGSVPWDRSRGDLQVVSEILSREVGAPSERNANVPSGVDTVVLRALRKAPGERFERMEDVVEALEPFVEADALGPGPPRVLQVASHPDEAVPAKSPWPRALVVSSLLALAGGTGLGFARRAGPPLPPVKVDAAAGQAFVESSLSANPLATKAYLDGLDALRRGSDTTARALLDRAIELDPTFAAAHLRRALFPRGGDITTQMREDIQSARTSRGSLSDHDRALLDAIEPWTRTPPDLREAERRLDLAVRAHPGDVDFAFQLACATGLTDDNAKAVAEYDSVIAMDPGSSLAWYLKSRKLVILSDVPGALAGYARCLDVSPVATMCLDDLAALQASEGKCAEMASTARRAIDLSPAAPSPHGALAAALFSLGAPESEVRASLAKEWERLPASSRPEYESAGRASLAMLSGRFAEADGLEQATESALSSAPDEYRHFLPAYTRMLIALETGRDRDAQRLAGDYLRHRQAWQSDDLGSERSIWVYAVEVAAGGITPAEFDKQRAAWFARDAQRAASVGWGTSNAGAKWAVAYATAVTKPEEARDALAALPEAGVSIDALSTSPLLEEPIGRTYLLAGRLDQAVATLGHASRACFVFDYFVPIFSTWAAFELGEALEARADTPGACAAYRVVRNRWGSAVPFSKTAAKAEARRRALRCDE